MFEHSPTAARRRTVIWLFAVAAVLQCLDWYSTLTASAEQSEANHLLLALAKQMSFPFALALTKALTTALLGILFQSWKGSEGRYDLEFMACLLITDTTLASVVVNNFANR